MSHAVASDIRRSRRSPNRVKRAKDTEHNDVETPSTPSARSFNISYQATAATSSKSCTVLYFLKKSYRNLVEHRRDKAFPGAPARNSRFSSEDDELLQQLKGEGLSWDEISDRFPERSKGTLNAGGLDELKVTSSQG
ncbi:hypothetical protein VTL71DRAFT_5031 [Oculimacula yallundae]|uniref:Myb-like domain-containing protein n=1 Tax=Oculimacula yallundae TaxID=86028 RepID=A0ABR4C0X2_9HELO